ncbi:transmembrane protein [Ceratobasidium sp. AG-Ba]|nr:transmembrane protein [Ceratobasidium sp. AG-Ba]QRW06099.1 transmembrane protein [Ceratobasidium sp. AG-Ba]
MVFIRSCLVALACASYAASQTTVRVDDSQVYSLSNPAGIQYSSIGWSPVTTGDASQRYQGTYTQNNVYGSQLYFAFRGSSITYYADQAPGFGAVTLSIDGGDNINLNWTNSGTATLYQQAIWSANGLSQDDHTIVVGNTNVDNATIGLDYFSVTSWNGNDIAPSVYGPGASSVAQGAVLVDNTSNDISYSGTAWEIWSTNANATTQARYFNRTEHCSRTPGSIATFTFNGTAVWHFADDYSGNSRLSFSLDGGAAEIIDTATTGHAWTSQKMFWNKTGLTPAPHTVTITHVGADGDFGCVDFFMYLPSSATPASANPTPTPSPLPVTSNSKSTPVGAIAGGVAAGVVLLVLIVILAIVFKRRQSRASSGQPPNHETYAGDAAYQTKQVDPSYQTNNLGHMPMSPPGSAPAFDPRPYSPYANVGGGASIAPTNWSGPTYRGIPEVQ